MNSSPAVTGGIAVTAGMIASIVAWLSTLAHISMPAEVSGAIAALILWAAHVIASEIGHGSKSATGTEPPTVEGGKT